MTDIETYNAFASRAIGGRQVVIGSDDPSPADIARAESILSSDLGALGHARPVSFASLVSTGVTRVIAVA